ncbi:hypothetical protein BGZ94_003751 [Podila epigama]|nr:hypothetical protein BGZ94_003751 [Podila epigama]
MEEVRNRGSSPSPIPNIHSQHPQSLTNTILSTAAVNPTTAAMSNSTSTNTTTSMMMVNDGSVSAEDSESNPSGSTHGVLQPSLVVGRSSAPVPAPVTAAAASMFTSGAILTPLQALEEGRDPTLAELIRALPPNWTDQKLKVHSGAVELSSLSSRHPAEIMFDIKKVVLALGMEIRSDSDFKIKCVRRKRKAVAGNGGSRSLLGGGGNNGAGHSHGSHHENQTHLHPPAFPVPDDNVSVMSSNLSIDREAWISARGLAAAAATASATASVANSTVNGGKKKSGIRSMFWRNSTSLSLSSPPPTMASVQQQQQQQQHTPYHYTLTQSHSQSQQLQHLQQFQSHHHHQQQQPQQQQHQNSMSPRQLPQVMNGHNGQHSHQQQAIGLGLLDSPPEPKSQQQQEEAGLEISHPTFTNLTVSSAPGTVTATGSPRMSATIAREPLYGEETIDSGEEIRFSIELCRMKNLGSLYSVDIRRMKGNLWTYKFLYHAVLNTLDLQGKGGYIAQQP